MKHTYRLPALLAALCMILCGCQGIAEPTGSEVTLPQQSTEPTHKLEPGIQLPTQDPGTPLPFQNSGSVRYTTQGRPCYVRYITDASQLPNVAALQKYDEEYFRDHALVLVAETVNSGSTTVEIGSIAVLDGVATVTLSRTLPNHFGTDVITTWLLWAEVEAHLDYQWVVANPTLQPGVEFR